MSVNASNSSGSGREGGGTRTGSSLLAPSKFSSNFLTRSDAGSASANASSGPANAVTKAPSESASKPSFPGFKASKLSGLTQSIFSSEPKKETQTLNLWTAKSDNNAETNEKPKEVAADQKPLNETDKENGEKPKTSPGKRSPEKSEDEGAEVKRVRLETAPPPPPAAATAAAAAPEKSEPTDEPEPDAKRSKPEPLSPKPTASSSSSLSPPPRSSETSSNFVFGENLSERAVAAPAAGFVFGQNLTERAENFSSEPKEATSPAVVAAATEAQSEHSLPASSASPVGSGSDPKSPPQSLTESAAAYYESHATPKRKYDEVAVVTGEEGEVNVVQMSVKLHWFDKATASWHERGRGILRLNDIVEPNAKTSAPPSSSRLVMRTAGSLRVILNTKLYRGMPVECPTEKNLRLTGMDDAGVLRVFLVTGASKDISNMYSALQFRIAAIDKACLNEDRDDDDDSDDEDGRSKIKAPRLK